MWRSALAVVILTVVSSPAWAVLDSISTEPTAGIPGMTTYTLTVTAGAGEKIIGFDFASDPGYAVYGKQLNQVNPFGLPTIFNDNNVIFSFGAIDVTQDTQFRVKSTDGIVSNVFESSRLLKATFNYLPAAADVAPNTWSVLQMALSSGSYGGYRGTFTIRNALGQDRVEYIEHTIPLTVPPFANDEVIDNVVAEGPGVVNHFVQIWPTWYTDPSNLRLGSYTPAPGVTGSGPAIAATLTGDFFNWNTHGSPLGTYKWLYTGRNFLGSDEGSITVHITQVPEPASWWLAVAGIGWILNAWRRRAKCN